MSDSSATAGSASDSDLGISPCPPGYTLSNPTIRHGLLDPSRATNWRRKGRKLICELRRLKIRGVLELEMRMEGFRKRITTTTNINIVTSHHRHFHLYTCFYLFTRHCIIRGNTPKSARENKYTGRGRKEIRGRGQKTKGRKTEFGEREGGPGPTTSIISIIIITWESGVFLQVPYDTIL